MPAAAIVTLVLVGVLVVALAATLVIVLLTLHRTSAALSDVLEGVRTIALRTAPLAEVLSDIASDVAAVADVSESLLTEREQPPTEASAR